MPRHANFKKHQTSTSIVTCSDILPVRKPHLPKYGHTSDYGLVQIDPMSNNIFFIPGHGVLSDKVKDSGSVTTHIQSVRPLAGSQKFLLYFLEDAML